MVSRTAYAGSKKSSSLMSLVRAMLGMQTATEAYMSIRERTDYAIIILIFGVLVAALVLRYYQHLLL